MINPESYSKTLRDRAILLSDKKILIAQLQGSQQEKDLTTPVNCKGYGRIRHFRWYKHDDWSPDPLPILPAAKALGFKPDVVLKTQVFQNAACNFRCWYCFVDYNRLSADTRVADYLTTDELLDMYLVEPEPPLVIDLSGGQPDIVPEWLIWTMESMDKLGLTGKVFLWSDDNLSTRYFWTHLTKRQREYAVSFPKYARVACFKGYDENSFSFNTFSKPEFFKAQFEIYHALLKEGFDMYGYVTFTTLPDKDLIRNMEAFVDRLQEIHPNLPLRTVPLKIEPFTPTQGRIKTEHNKAMKFQHDVHAAWLEQLNKRFNAIELNTPICDVPMSL